MSQISNRPVDWETLVKENEDRLYRAALAILGDAQEAEDAVQDTFLKFLEKAPAELDSPPAWLMRVLVNGCRDRLRAAWRRRSVPLWESLSLIHISPGGGTTSTGWWPTCRPRTAAGCRCRCPST